MSGSTISSQVTQTVTLGTSTYLSPLTITSTGIVVPSGNGGTGIIVPSSASYSLFNLGSVTGASGAIGNAGTPGSTGGSGGLGRLGGAGGAGHVGGDGVELVGAGSFNNQGIVLGASGGAGGAGGNGVTGGSASSYLGGDGGTGGAGGSGANITGGGTLTNIGTILGGTGGADGKGGNTGGRNGHGGIGGDGVILANAGQLTNNSLITGGTGGAYTGGVGRGAGGGTGVYVNGGTLVDSGTIVGGAGGGGAVDGTAGYAVQFGALASMLILEPGASFTGTVDATASADDILELTGTSSAELAGIGTQFLNFSEISFATGSAWTISGDSAGLAAGITLAGFGTADTIDLTDFAASSESYVSGTGLVLSQGSIQETLAFTELGTGKFTIANDGAGGTLIDFANCFAKGTRIATPHGEVTVEELAIGMAVKTLQAGTQRIKWIGRRSYAAPFANHAKLLPIHIRARALGPNMPARDLYVSPGHGICLDGVLIHAWRLVNGASISQVPEVDIITYFHIELERHGVVFAENCPAETFRGESFRRQFENAEEFYMLYPGHGAPEAPCLPHLEQGFALHAIQNRLAKRAGIIEPPCPQGTWHGHIDYVGPNSIAGWAQDDAAPEAPVCLNVYAGQICIARALANLYREDLHAAGLGSGCHGFTLALPPDLPGPLSLRRHGDESGPALRPSINSRAA